MMVSILLVGTVAGQGGAQAQAVGPGQAPVIAPPLPGPVGITPPGQEPPGSTPPGSTPPGSTLPGVAPPGTATPQPAPPPPSNEQAPSPSDPLMPPSGQPQEDSLSEPVPTDVVVVPPPTTPIPVNPVTPLAQETAAVAVQGLDAEVARAAAARAAAVLGIERATSEVAMLEARLATLAAEEQKRAARLVVAKERVKRMAVARYVATPTAGLNDVLESGSFTEAARRLAMLGAVAASDRRRIVEHDAAEREAGAEVRQVLGDLEQARASLTAAQVALVQADADLAARTGQLSAAQARSALVAGGFLFPVAGRHSYADTFGAPRMFGTPFAHLHEGTDIFAALGTPLVAAERGVLIKVGVAGLGGMRLWLVGASGTRYYYAHLSGFGPGAADGKVVEAGEVVGYVGNTGNALNTPSHLHFEVHPGGGAAVNPYPLLRIVDEAQLRLNGAPASNQRAK